MPDELNTTKYQAPSGIPGIGDVVAKIAERLAGLDGRELRITDFDNYTKYFEAAIVIFQDVVDVDWARFMAPGDVVQLPGFRTADEQSK